MTCRLRPQLRRWGIFNLVGVLGFGVQLTMLFVLKRLCGFGYLPATLVAVEISVLHNFLWHEHVTWRDVISPLKHGVWRRLLRFHLANGLISIVGTTAFTWLFVDVAHLPYLLANGVAVAICSVVNFAAGNRFVFREGPGEDCRAEERQSC